MLSIPPESRQKLKSRIWSEEGYRQFPYTDTNGHLTVACGRNLESNGISQDEALYLLDNDIKRVELQVWKETPVNYGKLNDARKCVILDMAFNMGSEEMMQFTGMWAAIAADDYEKAAAEMLSSKWHSDVGLRADKLAEVMRSGIMS